MPRERKKKAPAVVLDDGSEPPAPKPKKRRASAKATAAAAAAAQAPVIELADSFAVVQALEGERLRHHRSAAKQQRARNEKFGKASHVDPHFLNGWSRPRRNPQLTPKYGGSVTDFTSYRQHTVAIACLEPPCYPPPPSHRDLPP